jgi:hypothetical protein
LKGKKKHFPAMEDFIKKFGSVAFPLALAHGVPPADALRNPILDGAGEGGCDPGHRAIFSMDEGKPSWSLAGGMLAMRLRLFAALRDYAFCGEELEGFLFMTNTMRLRWQNKRHSRSASVGNLFRRNAKRARRLWLER